MKQIEVSVDVFAAVWAARMPNEKSEDEILTRLLKLRMLPSKTCDQFTTDFSDARQEIADGERPTSKRWTDVLVWTLTQFGGKATLGQIYAKSRQARAKLGLVVTAEHDASARECLESHCEESSKFRGKANLFHMPEGKGAGIWSLR